jgi:hypothetical protein
MKLKRALSVKRSWLVTTLANDKDQRRITNWIKFLKARNSRT